MNRFSTLKEDWLQMSNFGSQMRYYTHNTVAAVSKIAKQKWVVTETDSEWEVTNSRSTELRKFKHCHPFILHLLDSIKKLVAKKQVLNPDEQEQIMKYCELLEFFSFNSLNALLLCDRAASRDLMAVVCKQIEEVDQFDPKKWKNLVTFLEVMLRAVQSCLRIKRTAISFLKDSNKYLEWLAVILKCNVDQSKIVLQCLLVLKQILVDEQSVELAMTQFDKLFSLVMQVLTYNRKNKTIVRVALMCLRQMITKGKAVDEEDQLMGLAEVLHKRELNDVDFGPVFA